MHREISGDPSRSESAAVGHGSVTVCQCAVYNIIRVGGGEDLSDRKTHHASEIASHGVPKCTGRHLQDVEADNKAGSA